MISLISSWTDIERLSKGQVALELEACNIGTTIRQLAGQTVELQRTSKWPMVLTDPHRLQQMIGNILELFTAVEVRARINDDYCIVTFHDQGNMPPKRRVAILEALRADTPAAELGLRIALLLAQAHGGTLELNPHAREGLKLHLKLPLAKQLNLL